MLPSILVENIKQLDWHLSTGFIGISHLNPVLTLTGHADVAYRLLANEDYPSWLYPVLHGATTIWERWNGWTEEDGFFDPQMNSFNHYSLGSVSEWLYRHVAGIELDPEVAGFKQFVIKPYLGGGSERTPEQATTPFTEPSKAVGNGRGQHSNYPQLFRPTRGLRFICLTQKTVLSRRRRVS